MGSIPGFSSLSDETLNRGPMTIFQDKLLTRTDCDEAGNYVVPNVLSPWDLVFRPDTGHKLYHHPIYAKTTAKISCATSAICISLPRKYALPSVLTSYTAQQKFSMDFIFVLILERIRIDFFEVINKYGNP